MTQPDTASYLGRSLASDEDRPKLPWVKFDPAGTAVTVTITDKGMAPDYEYTKVKDAPKVQKTWPDGQLKEFLVVTGTTEKPATVSDGNGGSAEVPAGTEVNVAVKGKLMTQAIGKAVVEAGPKAVNADGKPDVAPGGTLWIKFTEWTTSKNGYDAKDFTAKYQPGAKPTPDTSGFLATPAGPPTPRDDEPPF